MIKISFHVTGIETPLPRDITLPVPMQVGNKIEYRNPEGNITYSVVHTRYVTNDSEVFQLVELESVES